MFSEAPESRVPADVAEANSRLELTGHTTMMVKQGTRFLGAIGVMDTPRPLA